MAKKDRPLDKDREKRLEKLAESWEEQGSIYFQCFKVSDLKLLLEHFPPLQDLIRRIALTQAQADGKDEPYAERAAAPGHGSEPLEAAQTKLAQAERQSQALREENQRLQQVHAAAQAELLEAKRQNQVLREENQRLQQTHRQAEEALFAAQAKLQQSERQNQALREENQRLQQALQRTQADLAACEKQLKERSQTPQELAWLRQEPELARQLNLADLPVDDRQALVRMVAVLAQRDNLVRLWDALRERCEAAARPANERETGLLEAALAWHNFNWPSRPYRLLPVDPGAPYDYTQHQRSRQQPTGETVRALWLPGIADGGGKPVCKPLVSTQ